MRREDIIRWHKYGEEKPRKETYYLTFSDHSCGFDICRYSNDLYRFSEDDFLFMKDHPDRAGFCKRLEYEVRPFYFLAHVTYWAELPERPDYEELIEAIEEVLKEENYE